MAIAGIPNSEDHVKLLCINRQIRTQFLLLHKPTDYPLCITDFPLSIPFFFFRQNIATRKKSHKFSFASKLLERNKISIISGYANTFCQVMQENWSCNKALLSYILFRSSAILDSICAVRWIGVHGPDATVLTGNDFFFLSSIFSCVLRPT